MPRTKYAPQDFRGYILKIRLTDTERKELERAAGEKSVSTWLRELGLKSARRRTK